MWLSNQDSINLRMLARLWGEVFKKHGVSVHLEQDIPLTGHTTMQLLRFAEKLYDPPSPRAFATVDFEWSWINHLRYQTTEDDFWASLGIFSEDYDGVIEKTEDPKIRLMIEFYFKYQLPLWFDRWSPDDDVPVSFAEDLTFLNRLGEEPLAELCYKMLDVVSQWFPARQVPFPDSPFDAVDTQTIALTPRVELAYSRQAEAPFAVSKIQTTVYHDIVLPRAWDGEMDDFAGTAQDFMGGQIESRFDQVAGNIAGVLEQLATIADQQQNDHGAGLNR